jgi:hypothetical protein
MKPNSIISLVPELLAAAVVISILASLLSLAGCSHFPEELLTELAELQKTPTPTPTVTPTPTPTRVPTIPVVTPIPTIRPTLIVPSSDYCPSIPDKELPKGARGGNIVLVGAHKPLVKVILAYKFVRSWYATNDQFAKAVLVEFVGPIGVSLAKFDAWANPEDVAKKNFRAHYLGAKPSDIERLTGTRKPTVRIVDVPNKRVCLMSIPKTVYDRND